MPAFDLPEEDVLMTRLRHMIQYVWGVKLLDEDIERWLNNFTGRVFTPAEERQYALWLLCNFVYYNQDEVRHLCNNAFKKYIHELLDTQTSLVEKSFSDQIVDIIQETAFIPLGRPSESGYLISYYFRQSNGLSAAFFKYDNTKIETKIKYAVYLDDNTITGRQLITYIKEEKQNWHNDLKVFFLTLVSSRDVEKTLSDEGCRLITAICLDERSKCFSTESSLFRDFDQHRERVKIFASKYGEYLAPGKELGFEGSEVLFGFYYNTPDNCLPIIWAEKDSWRPIFKRFSKITKAVAHHELGPYV